MKATTLWESPNEGATDSSGFTAFPGGCRFINGNYYSIGKYGDFWSASEGSNYNAWYRDLGYDSSDVFRYGFSKKDGFSVRCVRD
jgi:uncharacterized protein (TIGR02145 family)